MDEDNLSDHSTPVLDAHAYYVYMHSYNHDVIHYKKYVYVHIYIHIRVSQFIRKKCCNREREREINCFIKPHKETPHLSFFLSSSFNCFPQRKSCRLSVIGDRQFSRKSFILIFSDQTTKPDKREATSSVWIVFRG